MQTGRLDQRIILQSQTETNNFGEVVKSFTTVATVWGDVMTQKGQEVFEAARMGSNETIRVCLRYRGDIETDWRIQWTGQTYYVTQVDRSARRDGFIWVTCENKVVT